jgi:hypothetical protein
MATTVDITMDHDQPIDVDQMDSHDVEDVDELEKQLKEENPLLLRWLREAERADKMMDAVETRVDSLMGRLEFMLASVSGNDADDVDSMMYTDSDRLPSAADLLQNNDPDSRAAEGYRMVDESETVINKEEETSQAMISGIQPAIDQLTAELMEMLASQNLVDDDDYEVECEDDVSDDQLNE